MFLALQMFVKALLSTEHFVTGQTLQRSGAKYSHRNFPQMLLTPQVLLPALGSAERLLTNLAIEILLILLPTLRLLLYSVTSSRSLRSVF